MIDKIPQEAWIITSVSGLVLSTGVCVSTIRSSNLNVEIADVKVQTTARLGRVVELSKDLEAQKIALQEKEAAYDQLKDQFDKLSKYNQPLKMLEPAIKEVDRVNTKGNLEQLGKEIKQTAAEATAEIKEIVEKPKDDDEQPNNETE